MQTKATLIALIGLFATSAIAVPTYPGEAGSYDACPDGLYSNAQCCATDVLGVADLNCNSPSAVPTSASSFENICATGGDRARCCVLPVLGLGVLCQTPVGLGGQ
ncbi:Uu.00g118850.m01.CDS01 [Anthostomella pinea]|uniref:Uu.00g118850.m01.CDS01 n=1 Tax=Anthostomella pinea TaxID=933095 RepID=A0AAI8VH07_9PEZI|nr:Uu.00g118850.m01.CDS01 [Anthostomella pinea]